MTSVALYSIAGAPGVSTTVAAMAAVSTSETPLLVIEAAPAGGVVAARWGWPTGDTTVAAAAMGSSGTDLAGLARPWLSHSRVVVGHPSPAALPHAMGGRWLADRLEGIADPVVIDGGRIGGDSDQYALAAAAEVRWILLDPTADQVTAAVALAPTLTKRIGAVGLLCRETAVGPGRYPPEDVVAATGWPLVAAIPHDPSTAATLAGQATTSRARTLRRSSLLRTAKELATHLRQPETIHV